MARELGTRSRELKQRQFSSVFVVRNSVVTTRQRSVLRTKRLASGGGVHYVHPSVTYTCCPSDRHQRASGLLCGGRTYARMIRVQFATAQQRHKTTSQHFDDAKPLRGMLKVKGRRKRK